MKQFRNIEEEIIYHKLMANRRRQEYGSEEQQKAIDLSGCEEVMNVDQIAGSISRLGDLIITLKETSENYAFRPLFSDVKVIGKGIVFAKKAIRKLLKWYIEPICFQQTAYNVAVTHSIEQISKLQVELTVSIAELVRRSKQGDSEEESREGATQGMSCEAEK
jgi:hypothetical protein